MQLDPSTWIPQYLGFQFGYMDSFFFLKFNGTTNVQTNLELVNTHQDKRKKKNLDAFM